MGTGKTHLFWSNYFKLHREFFHVLWCSNKLASIAHCTDCSSIYFDIAIAPKNFNRSNGKEIQKIQWELHFSTILWNCSNFSRNQKNGYGQLLIWVINYLWYCGFLSPLIVPWRDFAESNHMRIQGLCNLNCTFSAGHPGQKIESHCFLKVFFFKGVGKYDSNDDTFLKQQITQSLWNLHQCQRSWWSDTIQDKKTNPNC